MGDEGRSDTGLVGGAPEAAREPAIPGGSPGRVQTLVVEATGHAGLQLGPSSEGRLTLAAGPIALSGVCGPLALSWPSAAGPLAALWCMGLWFCWRFGTKTGVFIRNEELVVVAPIRTFRTPTSGVVSASWRYGRMRITTVDGRAFALPFYTVSPMLSLSPRLLRSRRKLDDALKALVPTEQAATVDTKPSSITWVAPSAPFLAIVAVLAVGVEIGSIFR